MDMNVLVSLVAFVTAATITPGPNSIMIMASGVNYGFRKTLPHILGVGVGITIVISLAGVGLGQMLELLPELRLALLIVSSIYLLYFAWKIANAAPSAETAKTGTPLTFLQAALFQWVNPKVWALGMAAVAFYASDFVVLHVFIVALTFAFVGIVSNSSWAWFGTLLSKFLSKGIRLRIFNIVAALTLVASLYPSIIQQ